MITSDMFTIKFSGAIVMSVYSLDELPEIDSTLLL